MSLHACNFERLLQAVPDVPTTTSSRADTSSPAPATGSIPVFALSALAMKADKERSQDAGLDAHIVKPLRYKELYAVMGRLLAEPELANGQAAPPGLLPS